MTWDRYLSLSLSGIWREFDASIGTSYVTHRRICHVSTYKSIIGAHRYFQESIKFSTIQFPFIVPKCEHLSKSTAPPTNSVLDLYHLCCRSPTEKQQKLRKSNDMSWLSLTFSLNCLQLILRRICVDLWAKSRKTWGKTVIQHEFSSFGNKINKWLPWQVALTQLLRPNCKWRRSSEEPKTGI